MVITSGISKVSKVLKDFNNYLNRDLVFIENKFIFDTEELMALERDFVSAYNKPGVKRDEFLAIVSAIKDAAPEGDFLRFKAAYGI